MLPAGCCLCLPSSWEHTTILLLAVLSMVGRCDGDRLLDGVLQRKLQIRRRQHIALFQQEQQLLSRLHHGLKQLETVTPRQVELSASGQLVRLSGGAGPWEGMVEVYHRTQWRRVKANRWTEHETRVVCRQLGYVSLFSKFPSTMQTKSRRGRGSGDTLDIDKCIGDERSLLHCARARVSNEREVGVACYTADDLNSRCGQGEVPFGDRCYYFGRERVTRLKAGIRCQQRGAVLVRVTSQMKNDFLSGVMLWRGISGLHTSGYGESLDENTRLWFWRNSTKQFLFNNWSPVTAPSEDVDGPFQPRCITLRLSTLEDGSKYALWEPSACSDRMDYVCESHQSWRECISGNGASYSGNISTTESDQVCLPWSAVSRYPGLSSPTLKENYCRNPDRDERPWCFTSSDQFEYCDISTCPPFLPQPQTKARVACDRDSFRCGASDCVPAGYVCDGDQDCTTNRDEAICDALTYSFQAFPNNDLRVQGDFEGLTRYTSRTLRNCQYMCLVDDACRLFVYFEDESMCITTSTPLGRAWPTRMSGHTVYAVLGRYTPCPGYRCANFQCLNVTAARCDGVTDCDDLSDEKDCSADYGFALRLRGGSAPGSGRLEARIRGRWGSVCDDLFDVDAAYVACRELGFRRPQQFYLNGRKYVEGGGELLDYTLNGMLCLGNETSLSQCTLLQKPGLCVRGESVALECTNSASLCSSTVNSYQCRDGSGCVTQPFMCSGQNSCDDGSDESAEVCEEPQYRLEPGEAPRYLSIKPAGRFFRNVTAYNFGEAASNYVCGRLGLGEYGVAFQGAEVPDSRQMSVISCSDDGTQCQVSSENHLLPRASVRLHCRGERPPAPQLRLVGGQDTASGLVEVKPPLGEWGRLCALAFTHAQAKVICGELGHRGTADYTVQPRDPASRASLLALDCLGDEDTISDCIHTVWMNQTGDKACNGSGEVLVRCGQPARRQPLESLQVSVACGHGKPDLSRILGGSATDIPQHGWFAHLDVRKLGERKLKCGATVISEQFVLTAAHCLYRTDVGVNPTGAGPLVSRQLFQQSELFVVVGDSGAEVIDPSQRQIAVARTFRHPGHRAINLYHNDVALLQLAEPLVFSDSVQPACLPPADVLYAPQMQCQVTGLGKLSPGLFGALPDRLQVGNVSFFTRQQCQAFYGRSNITAGMVCAGDDRFLVDTCDGDSGGPLTCDLAGVTVVMGVTSWGHGCGRSDYPGVYTRVANYVQWIHDVISHS